MGVGRVCKRPPISKPVFPKEICVTGFAHKDVIIAPKPRAGRGINLFQGKSS